MKLNSLHHAAVQCGACGKQHHCYSHFSRERAQKHADKAVKACYASLVKGGNRDTRDAGAAA